MEPGEAPTGQFPPVTTVVIGLTPTSFGSLGRFLEPSRAKITRTSHIERPGAEAARRHPQPPVRRRRIRAKRRRGPSWVTASDITAPGRRASRAGRRRTLAVAIPPRRHVSTSQEPWPRESGFSPETPRNRRRIPEAAPALTRGGRRLQSGNGRCARASATACHAEGRGFESHQPLSEKGLQTGAFVGPPSSSELLRPRGLAEDRARGGYTRFETVRICRRILLRSNRCHSAAPAEGHWF